MRMIDRATICNKIVVYLKWVLANQSNLIAYGTGESALPIIPVIQGSQDAPIPTGTYIVVNQPFGETMFDKTNDNGTDINGNLSYNNHYKSIVSIYEVKGDGNYLKLFNIVNNMQMSISKQVKEGFSIGWFEPIEAIPDITETQWEKRFVSDANVYYTEVIKEKTGYISTVELINNIGGKDE